MKKIRVGGAVASVAVVALGLSACGGSAEPASEGPVTGDVRVWVVGGDTPEEARAFLKSTFEEQNPGSTLTIEEQAWDGLVDKYTTALSGSDAPDVVEIGNTQAAAFTSAGYFAEITGEQFEELGGDDLLPGFVEAGDWEGVHYALPYYSGSRVVFYSEQVLGGTEVPSTLDEYVATASSLKTADRSGIYWPGQDWYNALPFIWENGGFIAEPKDDGTWEAGFSSEGGLAGLEQIQEAFNTSNAPKDGQETDLQVPFCEGKVAFLSAPSWIQWGIKAEEDAEVPGCLATYGSDLKAFPLPGKDGGAAQVFAGGSNIAVAKNSPNPELAYKALQIMLSDEYQTMIAATGLIPAKVSLAGQVPQDDPIAAAGVEAAKTARLTPASPKWADVEAAGILQAAFTKIAAGQDVETIAKDLDTEIEKILNS
ncbi:extracellular solute-binding protein [Antribacter gilvus]|uniref:extracellular solute-binding protein n=1 Tax=Antribacter gilvus TaxID=2304675 RepID=UPI001F0B75CC|nr:extracellular solute-binding protein [Antribacter gilvus]